ncbi:hypothetical protein [Flexivirga oryzae]|uniref:Uncharacterized protein n=1 Tax=Flexivirga oryzae TaxID=1794944 RepID=A0A839N9Y9_9MICO|nr:hypothetical protein [Flexivirga oryzae]MBB2894570.1 hypothetical protein [Flexivirga oryzae]
MSDQREPEPLDVAGLYLDLTAEVPRPGTCPDCDSVNIVHRTGDPNEFVLETQHDASCPVYRGVVVWRRGDGQGGDAP